MIGSALSEFIERSVSGTPYAFSCGQWVSGKWSIYRIQNRLCSKWIDYNRNESLIAHHYTRSQLCSHCLACGTGILASSVDLIAEEAFLGPAVISSQSQAINQECICLSSMPFTFAIICMLIHAVQTNSRPLNKVSENCKLLYLNQSLSVNLY